MQLLIVCNLSYATMGFNSCMCCMQLKISCIRQLQNHSFLVVMYVMTMTWPYIAYSINMVARYSEKSRNSHWFVVERILQYLKRIVGHGLLYYGIETNMVLHRFCDIDSINNQQSRWLQVSHKINVLFCTCCHYMV